MVTVWPSCCPISRMVETGASLFVVAEESMSVYSDASISIGAYYVEESGTKPGSWLWVVPIGRQPLMERCSCFRSCIVDARVRAAADVSQRAGIGQRDEEPLCPQRCRDDGRQKAVRTELCAVPW